MNCDTCQDHLLDLVYDDEVQSSPADEHRPALRAHVEGCPACQASLQKLTMACRLSAQLPLVEPSAALDAAIMRAAREHVASGRVQDRVQARDDGRVEGRDDGRDDGRDKGRVEDDDGLWAAIVRWVGGFVMGPQVAMATIMMLVVAIGLWYFPSRRHHPESAGSTMINPDHNGELGPAATLEPAAPLDLDLDPRTGRIRDRNEEEGDAPSPGFADFRRDGLSAQQAGAVVDGELREVVENRESAREADLDDSDGLNAGAVEARALDPMAPEAPSPPAVAMAQNVDGTPARARRQSSPATDEALPADFAAALGSQRAQSGAGAMAGRAEMEQQAPSQATVAQATQARRSNTASAPSMPAMPSTPAAQAPGPTANTGDSAGATNQGELTAEMLVRQAQSYRQAGAFANAATRYEDLMRRFPAYPRMPQVLLDLADCYRRTGRLSNARTMLQRAQRYASVAPQAGRELARLDEMERARMAPAHAAPAREADRAATSESN